MYKLLLMIENRKLGISSQLLEFRTKEEFDRNFDVIKSFNEKSNDIVISTIEFRYE